MDDDTRNDVNVLDDDDRPMNVGVKWSRLNQDRYRHQVEIFSMLHFQKRH